MTINELVRDLVVRVRDDPRRYTLLLSSERLAVAVGRASIGCGWKDVTHWVPPVSGWGTSGGALRKPPVLQ